MAQRYGMMPSDVADCDVENIRVFHVATQVESKVQEKYNRNG